MQALWIRVEAHEVDSVRVAQLAEALGLDPVRSLGHYVALGGAIAEHAPDGSIGDVPDAAIERWGRWSGKRGKFAAAVRSVCQDGDGTFAGWLATMGKLIERRDAERRRKSRGNSAETPRPNAGNSAATGRDVTERDGTTSASSAEPAGSGADDVTTQQLGILRTALGEELWPDVDAFLQRRAPRTWRGWVGGMLSEVGPGSQYLPVDLAHVCRDDAALDRPIGSPRGLRGFLLEARAERLNGNGAPASRGKRKGGSGVAARTFANAREALRD